jgi:hypothetical protein
MGEELLKKILNSMNNETKDGLRNITSIFLISVFIVFVILFIKPITIINTALDFVEFPQWLLLLLASVIVYIVNIIIFSSDTLYYGQNKNDYSKAFQENWPSKYIMKEYGLNEAEATYKWFIEFNKWKEATHEMNQQRVSTFSRGFSCRLVYYIIRTSQVFFILSIAMIIGEIIVRNCIKANIIEKGAFVIRILFCVIMAFIWIICRYLNSPKKKNGVWARFDENNLLIMQWIKEHKEIFKNA